MVVLVAYIIGEPMNPKFRAVFDILYSFLLGAQWWLQIAVAVFMFQQDTGTESIRKTLLITTGMTSVLCISPIVGVLLGRKWIGVIPPEVTR